ncbi:MAG: CdaR family protein [Deltaproteobacteria bacterium]|jgi:YbbR domain-containing protein
MKELGLKNWFGTLGRNRLLKLLALLLAVALWFAVSGEERTETTLNMSLEMINLQPNLMVTSEVPPAIQVRVVGPRSIVNSLSQTRLTQTLDLTSYKAGRHTFYLGPNSFSLPRGVQVIRIQPSLIHLNLSATMTQTLPIKPILDNHPPQGYKLVSVKTKPLQVKVKGPSIELAELNFIPTLPIDVAHLKENTVLATDLDFKNLHLSLKESVPILAYIQISPKTITRTVSGVSVSTEPPASRISPSKVTLTVKGPWPVVHDLKAADLKAQVDIKNLKPGRHRVNISVVLPDGVHLVRSHPTRVTVTIAKAS